MRVRTIPYFRNFTGTFKLFSCFTLLLCSSFGKMSVSKYILYIKMLVLTEFNEISFGVNNFFYKNSKFPYFVQEILISMEMLKFTTFRFLKSFSSFVIHRQNIFDTGIYQCCSLLKQYYD